MSVTITAADVNALRKKTGAGLMDCKKALQETGGDIDAAIDFLRKKGQKVAEKRSDRDATEGVVIAQTNDSADFGVVVRLSSETDFVAKNEEFIGFAKSIADAAIAAKAADKDAVMGLDMGGTSIGEKVTEMVGKIGEKIEIADYKAMSAGTVVPYIHAGYKIGVLTAWNQPASDAVTSIGKDVAMQIAAMSPVAVDETGVSEDVKERELQIGREQAINEGKPEQIIDKIAQGKLNKFYKENTLLAQQFVKDGSKNVGTAITDVDKDLKVEEFIRVAIG